MKNLIKTALVAVCSICINFNNIFAQQIVYIPQALSNNYQLSDFDAIGKVKSIKLISDGITLSETKFNEKGLLTEVSTFDTNDNLLNKQTNTYNAADKLLKNDLEIFGDLTNRDNHQTTLFVYDKAGKLTAQNADKSEKKGYSTRYTYDANGIVTQKSYLYNGKIGSFDAYKYDAKGQTIEIANYKCINGSNCDYFNGSKYTYNENGQLVTLVMDGGFEVDIQYTYNEKGQVIAKKTTANESIFNTNEAYFYNEKGQLIKSESTEISDGTEPTAYITDFEYDEQGNWINTVGTTKNSDSSSRTTRVIEYY